MNEIMAGTLATIALIPSVLFAWISMVGGRPNGRIYKRIVAPFVFVSLVIVLSLISHKFSWWLVGLYPSYFISCMVGYGGDNIFTKCWRRILWSLIRTASCLPLCILTGNYTLLILQLIVGVSTAVILGVKNPLAAPIEESIINLISVIFVPFMVL
jgi:hypothetical protein